jgi:transposase, IS5 family
VDARWTRKGGVSHYGYKNHVNVDKDTKLITAHVCSDASVHDSQVFADVLRTADEGGESVWADSAYRSQEQEGRLSEGGHKSEIHERAYRGNPLSEEARARNKGKSRVRVRVEHVFGHMENSMGGIALRTIGVARAKVWVTLMNLAYNLSRVEVLIRKGVFKFGRVSASKTAVFG